METGTWIATFVATLIIGYLICNNVRKNKTIEILERKAHHWEQVYKEGSLEIYCSMRGEFKDYVARFYVRMSTGQIFPDPKGYVCLRNQFPSEKEFPLRCPDWRNIEGATPGGWKQVVFDFSEACSTIYSIPPKSS